MSDRQSDYMLVPSPEHAAIMASADRFTFDGAEGIAFWISEDDTFEHNLKVKFDELPVLKAFFQHALPGPFGGEEEVLRAARIIHQNYEETSFDPAIHHWALGTARAVLRGGR